MPRNRNSATATRPSEEIEKQGLPRYAEIQLDIERKISTGEWAPGARIPSEIDLLEVYKCSRMTVNKALSSLAAAGVINRKRKAGSFVAPPRVEEPLMRVRDIRTEILSIDRAYRFDISNRSIRTVTDSIDARHVGVPIGTRLLFVEGIHFADNLPFTVETRQINLDVVPQAESVEFTDMPPGNWLLSNVPFSEGEHSIRAISADALLAKQLQVTEGTACISIARRTWLRSDLITFVRLVYPGDRHRFVMRFPYTSSIASPV